jgi:CDP-4-dehydro-6-deoxyglucose reductase
MSRKITLMPSGSRAVAEDGESILQAALAVEFRFPHGCGNGQCGGCKARLLQGEIDYLNDYRPDLLSRREREQGMIVSCMASPRSEVCIEVQEAVDKPLIERRIYEAKLVEKNRLSEDVLQLVLTLPQEDQAMYYPGQYLSVLLDDGDRRAFSMASSPANRSGIELHIRHRPTGRLTPRLFNDIQVGDALRIEFPLGDFMLDDKSERPLLLIAGGTGFAPIKSMIESMSDQLLEDRRQVHLFWGAENGSLLYMDASARGWSEQYPCFEYTPVISGADEHWFGERGLVHKAVVARYPDLSSFDIYLAGPQAMVAAAEKTFPAFGADPTRCFSDAFIPARSERVNKGGWLSRLWKRKGAIS